MKQKHISNFVGTINNREYIFTCWAESTRYGFKHYCYCNGNTAVASYINRTWERYTFESVIIACIDGMFTKKAKDCSKSKRGRKVNALPTYDNTQEIAWKLYNKDRSNTDIEYDPTLTIID